VSRRWGRRALPWGRNRHWNSRAFGCMSTKSPTRDTSISTYRAKRNFAVTAEPAPGPVQQVSAPMFVVQKHHAHRAGLHWDFRLEHGGVLWSWAVRKGPSLDPADRRMAVHVEDHPIEIPLSQTTTSKSRGRSNAEGATAARQTDPKRPPAKGAVRATMPTTQEPQLCATAEEPPDSDAWISEIKFDGYRLIAAVSDGKLRLLRRNGLDWTARLPALARKIARLPLTSAMLDGELVSLRPDGVSSFSGLQAALRAGRDDKLIFYAFDLLHLDGWDLRRCGQLDRKRLLSGLMEWTGMLCFSDHTVGQANVILRNACRMHLEGIVCKRVDAPYRSGRGRSWVKVKCGRS
jgi:hypothetical protein